MPGTALGHSRTLAGRGGEYLGRLRGARLPVPFTSSFTGLFQLSLGLVFFVVVAGFCLCSHSQNYDRVGFVLQLSAFSVTRSGEGWGYQSFRVAFGKLSEQFL